MSSDKPPPRELPGQLAQLSRLRFTGTLRLRQGRQWHSIQLKGGLIRTATLAGSFEPLGQLLLRQGRLSAAALRRSLEQMIATERPQGELLRDMGLATPDEIESALQQQLMQRLLRLLQMPRPDDLQVSASATSNRLLGPCRPIHPLAAIWAHIERLPDTEVHDRWRRLGGALIVPVRRDLPLWLLGRRGVDLSRRLRCPTLADELAGSCGERRLLLFLELTGCVEVAPTHRLRPRRCPDAALLLGVRTGASRVELRRAFHRLALQLHPDRHPTAPAEERARLTRRFAGVTRAFHQLSRDAAS